jgi:hypothetical protein
VNFDQVFAVLEELPPARRPPYMMESSLSVLRPDRIARLGQTNCVLVAPGVESWSDYSNKAGVGRRAGVAKVELVAEHFRRLADNVPYVQANLMFGLDSDAGEAPIELSRLFMDRTPFAWPALNIPVPFGGTPLHDHLREEGRILEAMPFAFYYAPYLVTKLRNYDPIDYYEKLVALYAHLASPSMLGRRLRTTRHRLIQVVHVARTAGARSLINRCREILGLLRSDAGVRAFHEGRSARLPEFYHHVYEGMLKGYAGLIPRSERVPVLDRA